MEIINPSRNYVEELSGLALKLLGDGEFEVNMNAVRGLDYYKEGRGFEISCEKLGSQKQICGGGEYEGGIGFAIGIDRLLLLE